MKKSLILLASAILVVSCDIPQGGNKGRLKKTDDVVRYDDPNAPHGTYKPSADSAKTEMPVAKSDSLKTEAPKTEH